MATTIKYGPVTSTTDGVIYSAQSSAGRASKAWVVVRYRDPGDAGEILYEDGAVLDSLWCSPEGALHAVCRKGFHHTNESGAWNKSRVKKGGRSGYLVWGHGGRLFVGADDELYERVDGRYELSLAGVKGSSTDFVSAMDATSDAIYASRGDGTVHRLGDRWEPVALPRNVGPNTVLAVSEQEIYVSTPLGLYRGGAAESCSLVNETKLQYGARFQGQVIVASYSGGVFRIDGDALEPVGEGFSISWMDGAGAYLCTTGMAPEIRLFDGERWISKT